jgi:hypothetical protein
LIVLHAHCADRHALLLQGWLELNFEPIANQGRGRAPLRWEIYGDGGGDNGEIHEYFAPEGTQGGYTPFIEVSSRSGNHSTCE